MKKITKIALPLILLTSAALANDAIRSGFFLGAGVGLQTGRHKFRSNVNDGTTGDSFHKSAHKTSFLWDVFLGGRKVFERGLVLGMDVDFIWDHKSKTVTHTRQISGSPEDLHYSMKRDYAINVMPTIGFKHHERWMTFFKAGPSFGKFKFKGANGIDGVSGVSKSRNRVGVALGLGTEYGFNQHLSLLAALGFEGYGKVKAKRAHNFVTVASGSSIHASDRARFYSAKLALQYKF